MFTELDCEAGLNGVNARVFSPTTHPPKASPIAPLSQSDHLCVVSCILISTWQTWKLSKANPLRKVLEDPAWPLSCRLPFCSDSREPRYALAPPKLNLYGTESTCILGAEM